MRCSFELIKDGEKQPQKSRIMPKGFKMVVEGIKIKYFFSRFAYGGLVIRYFELFLKMPNSRCQGAILPAVPTAQFCKIFCSIVKPFIGQITYWRFSGFANKEYIHDAAKGTSRGG